MRRLSPLLLAALVLVLASGFVTARWFVAAEQDVSRFVLAGSAWVDPSAGVTVLPGDGYDGQFAYRLALDPTDLRLSAHGVTLDAPLRLQRIAYPALAWGVSLGQASWVPAALVVVNVLGLGVLALLAGTLARSYDRPAWHGLLLVAWPGYATTVGRDLTEVVTAVLLLGGVLAVQRRSAPLAALLFSAAVLSRETALLLYAVLAAVELLRRPSVRAVLWAAVPVVVFGAWQAVCAAVVGRLPLTSSSGKNLVLPLQDLLPAAAGWARGALALDRQDLITTGQLVAVAVLVVAAGLAVRRSAAPLGVRAAWGAALLLVLSLSDGVWRGPADFRTATELGLLSGVVLLGSDRSLRVPAVLLAGATALTALFRVTSL